MSYLEDDWDGTVEGLYEGCPWGGLGNYVPADHYCDWECKVREACKNIKKKNKETKNEAPKA